MFISDFVNQFSSNQTVTGKVPKGSAEARAASNSARTDASLARLSKGSTFEGNVSDIKGDKVTLSLENGKTVTARLAEDVPITKGESIFFEVKSNDGTTVNIRPISTGLMNNPIIAAALDSAGLSITEKNASLVDALMKEQLPIDSKSLGLMQRAALMHPETSVENLATMQKAGIPITDEMVQQFNNYKTSEGGIVEGLYDMADAMTETFLQGDVSAADIISFNENLTSILSTDEGVVPHMFDSEGNIIAESGNAEIIEVAVSEEGQLVALESDGDTQMESSILQDAADLADPTKVAEESESAITNNTDEVLEAVAGKSTEAKAEGAEKQVSDSILRPENEDGQTQPKTEKSSAEDSVAAKSSPAPNTVASVLSDSAKTQLASILKDAGINSPEFFDEKGNLRGEVTTTRLVQAVAEHIKDNPEMSKQDLLKLLTSDSYKNILKDAMTKRWTMDPQDVADKAKVKDFYAKLSVDMERLTRAASELTKSGNPVSDTASSVKNNVDFINQVNQIYSYVQLPLKLSGQEATGDLYVFSNKKGKRNPDDELSAFLHFDLDSLGATDISIKMKKKNVSTDFYMDNDISFQLIEKNLPVLESRLNKMGYNVTATVKNESKPMDFVDDFIKHEAPVGGVRRYSFDVTA